MGLLDYDYDELAERVQHGLDRLTANFLTAHRARVRLDQVDFHGREHLDLELEYAGHRLRVRQMGRADEPGAAGVPEPEEFESLFDGRPSREWAREELAAWLRGLPAGAATPTGEARPVDPHNPFLAEARPRAERPLENPLLGERPASGAKRPNPLAGEDDEAERRKRRALEWLSGDQD